MNVRGYTMLGPVIKGRNPVLVVLEVLLKGCWAPFVDRAAFAQFSLQVPPTLSEGCWFSNDTDLQRFCDQHGFAVWLHTKDSKVRPAWIVRHCHACGHGPGVHDISCPVYIAQLLAARSDGLQDFDVWMEGYRCNGGGAKATWVGMCRARTFADAVREVLPRSGYDLAFFDAERMTWGGCRFFDNPTDARKGFG